MRKLVIALALAITAGGCTRAPEPPPFKAVVETRDLMEDLMERQADIVWGATGFIVTAEGVEERRPKSDEDWLAVKAAAVNLTEAGNLLLFAPRAQDGGQWVKNVQAMMGQGQRMIDAIDRRDTKAMFDVGSDLYDTCTNCHMHYMPAIKDLYRP
ncbi:MAG TPA: hypothetical protein VM032_09260 [Vicinamibacterales bacterium]|nr:hypothetical protein [Vicinamibacterales bacterium]